MVCKTANIDSNFKNISFNMLPSCGSCDIYGFIEVSVHCFYCFYFFRSIMRINSRTGGKKNRDFQFYFYFNLPNNNVGGSVNQSIIKKRPY